MNLKSALLSLTMALAIPLGASAAGSAKAAGITPFENPSYIVMDPDQGVVTSLKSFSVSIPSSNMLDYSSYEKVTLSDYSTGQTIAVAEWGFGDSMTDLSLELEDEITEPGKYVLTIPDGVLIMTDSSWDDVDVPESKWLYVIEGQVGGDDPDPGELKPFENPSNYVMTPGQGKVESLETFKYTITNSYELIIKTGAKAVLTNHITGAVVSEGKFGYVDGDDSSVTITLDNKVTAAGTYVLTIDDKSIYESYNDQFFAGTRWLYVIEGQGGPTPKPEPVYVVTPAEGNVASLSELYITVKDYMLDPNTRAVVTLTDVASGAEVTTGKLDFIDVDEGGFNDEETVKIILAAKVTKAGQYLLTVPAGAISADWSISSPELKWTYTVTGEEDQPENPEFKPFQNPGYTMFPAQGVVTSMRQFVIEYTDASYLDWDDIEADDVALINQKTGEKVCGVSFEEDEDSWAALVITLDQVVNTPGTYVLDIPEGVLFDYMDPTTPLPASKWLYVIEGDEPEEPEFKPFENDGVTINPEQGIYTELSSFELLFRIQMPDINYTKTISLIDNASGETVATGKASYGPVINVLMIDLDKTVSTPGAYTLVCPEGTFYDGGSWDEEDLPEFKFAYIVSEDGVVIEPEKDNFLVNPDPEDGEISSLDKIVLTFYDYKAIYKHSDEGIKVVDENGDQVAKGTLILGDAADEMVVSFYPTVTERGTYTVVIPARAMTLGDMKDAKFSAPIELTYQVSGADGIGSISVDINEDTELYNLQGIRVTNPVAGQVYLVRNGNKFVKVLVK